MDLRLGSQLERSGQTERASPAWRESIIFSMCSSHMLATPARAPSYSSPQHRTTSRSTRERAQTHARTHSCVREPSHSTPPCESPRNASPASHRIATRPRRVCCYCHALITPACRTACVIRRRWRSWKLELSKAGQISKGPWWISEQIWISGESQTTSDT